MILKFHILQNVILFLLVQYYCLFPIFKSVKNQASHTDITFVGRAPHQEQCLNPPLENYYDRSTVQRQTNQPTDGHEDS